MKGKLKETKQEFEVLNHLAESIRKGILEEENPEVLVEEIEVKEDRKIAKPRRFTTTADKLRFLNYQKDNKLKDKEMIDTFGLPESFYKWKEQLDGENVALLSKAGRLRVSGGGKWGYFRDPQAAADLLEWVEEKNEDGVRVSIAMLIKRAAKVAKKRGIHFEKGAEYPSKHWAKTFLVKHVSIYNFYCIFFIRFF